MAKYLQNNNGELEEVTPTTTSSGVGSANTIVQLDGTGKLDSTLFPTGYGPDTISILASETINSGDLVNIYSNAGVANVRKAIATSLSTKAHGYSLQGAGTGTPCTVYFDDVNTGVTSLTPGEQFLSATTAGKVTTTPPATSTQVVQKVGVASSATTLHVSLGPAIKLA